MKGLPEAWVNKRRLNPDKAAVLLLGPDSALGSGHVMMLDETTLPQKVQARSLAALLALAVSKSAFHQFHPFLEKKDLPTITHTLVMSKLYYCNALYMR